MRLSIICTCIALLLTTACHRIDSHHIPTHAVEADIVVDSYDGITTDITATLRLRDEPMTYLQLGPTERLVASVGSFSEPMYQGMYSYTASLPQHRDEELVRVSYFRHHHPSAGASEVIMPSSFELSLYEEHGYDSDTLIVEWDAITYDPMEIELSGPCIYSQNHLVDGFETQGALFIDSSSFRTLPSWDGQTCPVDITVTRSRTGQLDPSLWGGSMTARQTRMATFELYY